MQYSVYHFNGGPSDCHYRNMSYLENVLNNDKRFPTGRSYSADREVSQRLLLKRWHFVGALLVEVY